MRRVVTLIAGNNPIKGQGGHSAYVRAHGRAIRRAGFEPHVFGIATENSVSETDFGILHLVRSPFRPFWHLLVPLNGPLLARSVTRFLMERPGPHLLHGIGVWSWVGVEASRRLRQRGVESTALASSYDILSEEARARLNGAAASYSWSERLGQRTEVLWDRALVDRFERGGYNGSRKVFVNYQTVRRLLMSRYGIDSAKIEMMPYCSETAFDPGPGKDIPSTITLLRSAGVPILVAVSRHDPRKGLAVLLHALAEVHQAGTPFRACLVGMGHLLEEHRRLAKRLGLDEVVRIEGWAPKSYEYLRHSDIFVLPSTAEGSGSLSLLEALQAGVAIVASRVDGIPEDVTDGVDALLVPPGDYGALTRAITTLLSDTGLRGRLAAHGRETFATRFSADAFTGALASAYASLGFPPT